MSFAALALVLFAAPPPSTPDTVPALEPVRAALPKCPAEAKVCVGLDLHVVVKDGVPVQSPAWLAHEVGEANRHFAKLGVGFEVTAVSSLPAELAAIHTRLDRDLGGRKLWTPKVIHVLLVEYLEDIDHPGVPRLGVHWRDRAHRSHRWVYLSSVAMEWVLAHEIGHFFGLPHSKYPDSIMNKTPRLVPPPSTWSFARPEYRIMQVTLRTMLRTGDLVALPKS